MNVDGISGYIIAHTKMTRRSHYREHTEFENRALVIRGRAQRLPVILHLASCVGIKLHVCFFELENLNWNRLYLARNANKHRTPVWPAVALTTAPCRVQHFKSMIEVVNRERETQYYHICYWFSWYYYSYKQCVRKIKRGGRGALRAIYRNLYENTGPGV